MNKTALNNQFLVKILLRDKKQDPQYTWEVGKPKTFWKKAKKSGWYWRMWEGSSEYRIETEQEILEQDYVIHGMNVYRKPYVEFWYTDGTSYRMTFNTIEEAKAYYDANTHRITKLTEI